HDIDYTFQRKRNKISDVRSDRHLTLEAPSRKALIIDEGLPQQTLRFCRVSAQETRQSTHRTAFTRDTTTAVLGEQVAQLLRPCRIEHTPPSRPFSSLHDCVDDTMQSADVLLRGSHALKYIAQVDAHGAALFLRAKRLDALQLAFEIGKERVELLLRRWRGFFRHGKRQPALS